MHAKPSDFDASASESASESSPISTSTKGKKGGKGKSLVIVTAANSQYQEWQKRTAIYHIQKQMPDTPLVTVVAKDLGPNHPLATTVDCALPYMGCPAYEYEGVGRTLVPGDDFIVYNRAHSMNRAMEENYETWKADGIETILLIEPDMILMRDLSDIHPKRGSPIGHEFFYMIDGPIKERVISHCTPNPEYYRPVGLPMAIHIDDFKELLPLWIEKTIAVRTQEWGWDNGAKSWIADMWGMTCAFADLKINATASHIGLHTNADKKWDDSAWAIHYTFFAASGDESYRFEKRDWTVGAPRPRPYGPIPHEGTDALSILFADALDEALVAVYGTTDKTKYANGEVGQ